MAVKRLLPDLNAGTKKPEWNFQIGTPEEARYDKCIAASIAAEDLMIFTNKKGLETRAITTVQADQICTATAANQNGLQNDFTRSGADCRRQLYQDAAAAGYNINNVQLRTKLDKLVSLYHSYMYEPFTESGRLLK